MKLHGASLVPVLLALAAGCSAVGARQDAQDPAQDSARDQAVSQVPS